VNWPDPRFNLAATVLTALVVVLLVGILPWLGRRRYAALEANRNVPGRLSRAYLRGLPLWWSLTALVALLPVISPGVRPADLGLVLPSSDAAIEGGLFLAVLLALSGLTWRRIARRGLGDAPRPRWHALIPRTRRERQLAVLAAVTAGVCEEVVFRGLLIAAGIGLLGLRPFTSLLLAAAVFGLGHAYQGAANVVRTAVMGVLLGVLYLLSGSLLLPAVLHTAIDLFGFLVLSRVPMPDPVVTTPD
jgi:membrane protease YdiL (CAAX protease family)